MRLTVEEVYDKLVNDDKILTKEGRITFTLGDIDIVIRQKDVVGNIMQEWVEGWLNKNNVEYALYKNKDTRDDGPDWLSTVIDNYEKHYGVRLSVPR